MEEEVRRRESEVFVLNKFKNSVYFFPLLYSRENVAYKIVRSDTTVKRPGGKW